MYFCLEGVRASVQTKVCAGGSVSVCVCLHGGVHLKGGMCGTVQGFVHLFSAVMCVYAVELSVCAVSN